MKIQGLLIVANHLGFPTNYFSLFHLFSECWSYLPCLVLVSIPTSIFTVILITKHTHGRHQAGSLEGLIYVLVTGSWVIILVSKIALSKVSWEFNVLECHYNYTVHTQMTHTHTHTRARACTHTRERTKAFRKTKTISNDDHCRISWPRVDITSSSFLECPQSCWWLFWRFRWCSQSPHLHITWWRSNYTP